MHLSRVMPPPPLEISSPLKSSEDDEFSGAASPTEAEPLSKEERARVVSHAQCCLGRVLDSEEEMKVLSGVLGMKQAVRSVKEPDEMDDKQLRKCLATPVHRVIKDIYLGTDRYLAEVLSSDRHEGYPKGFDPTIIITVCERGATKQEELDQLFKSGIAYIYVPIKDSPESFEELRRHLPKIMGGIYSSFISEEQVFIHCRAGQSRSAYALIMSIVEITGCSFCEGMKLVKSVRPQISSPLKIDAPNLAWRAREYYKGKRVEGLKV